MAKGTEKEMAKGTEKEMAKGTEKEMVKGTEKAKKARITPESVFKALLKNKGQTLTELAEKLGRPGKYGEVLVRDAIMRIDENGDRVYCEPRADGGRGRRPNEYRRG